MSDNSQLASFNAARTYFEPYGLTCVYWHPSRMQRPDYHNEIELNLLPTGSVVYLHGGKKVEVSAGQLCAFWAAMPHQVIDFSGEAPYLVATIPLQTFLQWRLPEEFVHGLMQGNFLIESYTGDANSDERLFTRWEADLGSNRPELEKPVLLEMQARLARFALNYLESRQKRDHLSTLSDKSLSKVEQMACFIAQHYNRKLTTDEVSQSVGLHPNYAMNLFRQTFGTTLTSYLSQHRVSHARRLLMTTQLSITEIAMQSGFSSISRFNEVFSRHCQCSPREYRKSHLG